MLHSNCQRIIKAITKLLVIMVNLMKARIYLSRLIFGIPKTVTTDCAKCFTGFEFYLYYKQL